MPKESRGGINDYLAVLATTIPANFETGNSYSRLL